ncbi:MAG: FAD-dependent oxidoreductase [Anaerolineae bacterium]|jgi:monoamine oxidase|nr:FAD-dependent oxidoreductase [Anaerolineae bacterium]
MSTTAQHAFTRRAFLQALLLGGTMAALAFHARLLHAQDQNDDDSDRETVVIIGAGAAGIAAGAYLQAEGYKVILLEARDRIGGRVLTDRTLASHPVELGAEFVHGDNVITWDLADEYGLASREIGDEAELYLFTSQGVLSPDQWANIDGINLIDDDELDRLAESWYEEEDSDLSLAELLDEHEIDLDPDVRKLLNNDMASDYGADLKDLGVLGFIEQSYEGDDSEYDGQLADGYTPLLEAMSENLEIRLNKIVNYVEWDDEGAIVYTEDDDQIEADYVIVTLPLGVLQAGDVEFDPPLPDDKQEAIDALGAGHVDKIILKFSEPFWEINFAVIATIQDTQIWWRPGYGREDEASILTALVGGDAAKRFEAMSEAEVITAALRDLEAIFQVQNLRDKLVEGRFINWGGDRFSKMGYSYVPVDGSEYREVLAESVGSLYFAGEATHMERAATVHGAIESGWRAADEIMEM